MYPLNLKIQIFSAKAFIPDLWVLTFQSYLDPLSPHKIVLPLSTSDANWEAYVFPEVGLCHAYHKCNYTFLTCYDIMNYGVEDKAALRYEIALIMKVERQIALFKGMGIVRTL